MLNRWQIIERFSNRKDFPWDKHVKVIEVTRGQTMKLIRMPYALSHPHVIILADGQSAGVYIIS